MTTSNLVVRWVAAATVALLVNGTMLAGFDSLVRDAGAGDSPTVERLA